MKRLFFATTLMILVVGVGWRAAPPDARERLLGFVGMANRADPARIVKDIKEKIVPEDPAAKRAALLTALKRKIQEMKTETEGAKNTHDIVGAPSGAPTMSVVASAARAAAITKAADEAVQLADQVAQAGGNTSVSGQIVQRVLDRLLPALAPVCSIK